jgi:DNA-binding response OmpR family regulator
MIEPRRHSGKLSRRRSRGATGSRGNYVGVRRLTGRRPGRSTRESLVQLLYGGAPVRVWLLETEDRGLPFARDLFVDVGDPVIEARIEEIERDAKAAAWRDSELVVLVRDSWREEDTELCRRLHQVLVRAPLLALSGPCETSHRSAALRAGADDFLSMPFEVEELVARSLALVRRASSGSRYARIGPFAVDLARRQVVLRDRQLGLTLREYDLLSRLIERAGEVVTRRELESQATPSAGSTDSNVIDVHMSRIREKLGADAGYIETVRGLGYRLRCS